MFYANHYCSCVEEFVPEHVFIFTGLCKISGKTYSVRVPAAGLHEYDKGMNIQDAFPNMSKDDREFLISGITPEEWNKLFVEETLDKGNEEDENPLWF